MRDNPWRRLVTYLLTTFSITWICWGATALLVHFTSLRATDIPAMALFVLGGFGPTIAACVCLPGGFSWKNLAHFLTRRAPHAALYFLLCALLEVAAFWLSSHGWSAPADSAGTSLIAIVSIFLVVTLVAGGNEEWGWRGIMQPLLARRFHNFIAPDLVAALVVGAVWACWHIPLWWIDGNPHQGSSFAAFALTSFALSAWLGLLVAFTRSVLWCMVFHGLANTLMTVFPPADDVRHHLVIAVWFLLAIPAYYVFQRVARTP